jgi:hypothetical protein
LHKVIINANCYGLVHSNITYAYNKTFLPLIVF